MLKFVSAEIIRNMIYSLILQTATNAVANTTSHTAAMPAPEKQPALLSLVYMGGLALMIIFLIISLLRNRRRRSALAAFAPRDLPDEVRKRLGSTSTNRGLRALRVLFIVLALAVFGFHVYWARFAEEQNERFQQLNYKDLRNRRLSESTLRGWILDRTGRLDHALALYHRDANGNIDRVYPEDEAMAHLFGSDRGDPGLERALFGVQSGAVPEALQVVQGQSITQAANVDVKLTIHRDLQREVVQQLKGRHGAAVVLNPQNGEVLAIYSNPSYSLDAVQDAATWIKLEADKRDNPLVNRALGEYYVPGSTFKTMVMIAAHNAGLQDTEFNCTLGGYVAQPGAKPITDDAPGEYHGVIGIDTAYMVSCNEYFAQMAVKLGPERMKEAAKLLGIGAYDSAAEATRGRKEPQLWNASTEAVRRALAPRESTIVTAKDIRPYDLALEGYGQGMAGQMTPFQMALLASAIANMDGKLMKPKIELNRPDEVYSQAMSPQIAARLRQIMGLVTNGPRGTARGVFAELNASGLLTGGKTGTAQKVIPVYDKATGEPKMRIKLDRDIRGKIIGQHEETVMDVENPRIDSWFLCIAPLERPTIAIAVIVEGGGYGSKVAAPIARSLVLKSKELGLLGNASSDENQTNQTHRRQQQKTSRQRPDNVNATR